MRRSVAIFLLCIPQIAWATDQRRIEISPMLGMRMGGGIQVDDRAFRVEDLDVGVTTSASFGVRCGLKLSERFGVEALLSHQSTTFGDEDGLFGEQPGGFFVPGERKFLDVQITSYQGGLVWLLHRGWSQFYLAGGAGMSRISPSLGLPTATRLSANGGVGVKIDFNERLGLRGEWRSYWIDTDETVAVLEKFRREDFRDCISPCTYTYRYQPRMIQGELSIGLVFKV